MIIFNTACEKRKFNSGLFTISLEQFLLRCVHFRNSENLLQSFLKFCWATLIKNVVKREFAFMDEQANECSQNSFLLYNTQSRYVIIQTLLVPHIPIKFILSIYS